MMAAEDQRWPGDCDECHPEVFTQPPPKRVGNTPNVLSDEQFKQFFEDGYVIVENILTPDDIEPVKSDIEVLVDDLAQKLHAAGKITKLHKDADVFKRLILLEKEFPGTNILLHKGGKMPPSFCDLWTNERLLDIAEQLLGTTEIKGHPVWNLRTKTPKNDATVVPWHQDSGYMENITYQVLQLTAWIPLLDTNEHNGGLQMVKGAHKKGKIGTHQCCYGNTWYIMMDDDEMTRSLGVDMNTDVVTTPVPYGAAIIFNNLTPHRSLPNVSDIVRWSLDLRYQRADKPVGFFDVKEGILLRSKDPDYKLEFSEWNNIDRTKRQLDVLDMTEDEFDTSISGPWMKKWEIAHENQHTDHMKENEASVLRP